MSIIRISYVKATVYTRRTNVYVKTTKVDVFLFRMNFSDYQHIVDIDIENKKISIFQIF